jgi:UDP-N-acetylmuramate--alanine ligase
VTRPAADIGKGLAPARQARPIRRGEKIHVIGASGAGASAAVLHAHHAGARVSGCDAGGPSPYTDAVLAAGIDLEWRHDPAHVNGDQRPERLAVTKALTAVDPNNAELAAAAALRIPAEPWQQLIADAAATSGQMLVAVAGTHGKSTTTGWLVDALVRAGRDPSAFVGALLDVSLTGGLPATARRGKGDVFLVEADEYAGNFDAYRPHVMVLLNAEWDHPDVFEDEQAVLSAFEAWIRRAPADAVLVANVGDAGVRKIVARLDDWSGRMITAGLDVDADIRGQEDVDDAIGGRVLVVNGEFGSGVYSVGLAGRHNLANALMVVAMARLLDLGWEALGESLARFGGVGRRLELKGEVNGVVVLDDYGHHPTAIALTLDAVRSSYPDRPVWAVYEPLTYHRTAQMLDRFAEVLASADHTLVADIWPGRDPDTTITSAEALAEAVNAVRGDGDAKAPGSVEQTADYLARRVSPGDVVLVMGGGRSYVIAARLVELLKGRQAGAQ